MKCDKCGKDIPEQIDYCPTCKIQEIRTQKYDNENQIASHLREATDNGIENTESKQDDNTPAEASFFYAIFPYILFGFCYIISGGWPTPTGNSGEGIRGIGIWWAFLLYSITGMIPLMARSIVLGIKGLKSKDRIYSYIGLALSLLPLATLLILMILSLIDIYNLTK